MKKNQFSQIIPQDLFHNLQNIVDLKELYIYTQKAKKIKKTNKLLPLKIALISTFTIKGLAQVISSLCEEIGIYADIYETPYHQHTQMILNKKSQLYIHKPEVIIFLTHLTGLFPELDQQNLYQDIKDKSRNLIAQWKSLLQILTEFSNLIICSTLTLSPYNVFGLLNIRLNNTQLELINRINAEMISWSRLERNLYFFDTQVFFQEIGWLSAHDPKFFLLGDYYISPRYLPYLGYKLIGFIKAYKSKNRKCIVVDLDNTLWGGVIGEDGLTGIKIGHTPPHNAYLSFQKTLLKFYERGILLAINSNNNKNDALEALERHPDMILRPHHFAALYINWENKSDNLKNIARELNIGLDSLVFIDDDPKKRLMIRQILPQVKTPELPIDPSLYSFTLLTLNDFTQLTLTNEDLSRGKHYFAQRKRQEIKTTTDSINDYLQNLNIKIRYHSPPNDFALPRLAQLSQRTNQFNMTTRRYTEIDISRFINSKKHRVYAAEVIDRFGSYGLCGLLITHQLEKKTWDIDTFLLSCRVLGMGIEISFIAKVIGDAKKEKIENIIGLFIPTIKNLPARDIYKQLGFVFTKKLKKIQHWTLNLKAKKLINNPFYIEII